MSHFWAISMSGVIILMMGFIFLIYVVLFISIVAKISFSIKEETYDPFLGWLRKPRYDVIEDDKENFYYSSFWTNIRRRDQRNFEKIDTKNGA